MNKVTGVCWPWCGPPAVCCQSEADHEGGRVSVSVVVTLAAPPPLPHHGQGAAVPGSQDTRGDTEIVSHLSEYDLPES